jgi:hypothetical protein
MISLRAFDSGMASKHKLDNRKIDNVESAIYLIRGQRVMLDSDLRRSTGSQQNGSMSSWKETTRVSRKISHFSLQFKSLQTWPKE